MLAIRQSYTQHVTTYHPPLFTGYEAFAMVDRVTPTRPQPTTKVINTRRGFITSAETVMRCRYILDEWYEVYLMDGRNQQIVSLKPAKGELLRKPTRFTAVVWANGEKKEIEIKAWQPLSVR